MAALAVMGTGFLLEYRYLGFAPPRNWRLKTGAFSLGVGVCALACVGLKILFAGLEPAPRFAISVMGWLDCKADWEPPGYF